MSAERFRALHGAETFRALHGAETPLLLPNAWDVASGAALARAGFRAIGTTSLGVAAAHGLSDATGATREQTVALARGLAHLPVMVTVDIEAGFADDPAEVVALVADLGTLGVVGINLEDGRPGGRLADPERQAALIRAIKQRVPHLFVNARTDTHWLVDTPPPLSEALHRARTYVAGGADGVFVPGVSDPALIAKLVAEVGVPVNVLYTPGGPSLDQLTALGVGRVSTGSLLFRAALGAAVSTAEGIRDGRAVAADLPGYREVQGLADLSGAPTRPVPGPAG